MAGRMSVTSFTDYFAQPAARQVNAVDMEDLR
jgi:hypothetical protein